MNEALSKEVKKQAQNEILEVLRKNNLPTPKGIQDAVCSLLKEVSCAHQNGSK